MSDYVMVPWGESYGNKYLAIPADKAAAFLDSLLTSMLYESSNYRIEDDTTFKEVDLNLADMKRIQDIRLVASIETQEEEEDPEPASDLEARVEQCKAGDIPTELS